MNVMGTAPKDVDRLGASLVALGNDGASTEADILKMASYITGAASLIGASESDVLGLANAMTSMGINAERGGGVMTRVMQDVYSAVQMGGSQLDGFAKVAGHVGQAVRRRLPRGPDPRDRRLRTDGLGKAKDSGGNVVKILNDLGYVGTQDTAVLLQLASAPGLDQQEPRPRQQVVGAEHRAGAGSREAVRHDRIQAGDCPQQHPRRRDRGR
jgi:TP901 family phage tail tape measure protein